MTLDEFRAATKTAAPPAVSPLLRALWHDARGEWDAAHELAQEVDDADGAWVHAYLHRKEGDAKQPVATDALGAEWDRIAVHLLGGG